MSTAPEPKHQKVGWLELFYDLVFVVVIEKLTDLLHDDPGGHRIWMTIALTFVVWVAWFNVSALTNVSGEVGPRGRPLLFASMAGIGVLALGVEGVPEGHFWLFVIGYTIARSAIWPLWMRGRRRAGLNSIHTIIRGPGLGFLFLLTPLLNSARATGVAILVLCLLETSLSFTHDESNSEYRLHGPHMVERIGLLLMIVLGESVVQIVSALDEKRTPAMWVCAACAMCLISALWWLIYEASMDKLERVMNHDDSHIGDFIGGPQLAIVSGLIMLAAGIADGIHSAGEAGGHLHGGSVTCLCLGQLFVSFGATSLSRRAFSTALGLEEFNTRGKSKEEKAAIKTRLREQHENHGARTSFAWVGQFSQVFLFLGPPLLIWRFAPYWPAWIVIFALFIYVVSQIAIQTTGERRITKFFASAGRTPFSDNGVNS